MRSTMLRTFVLAAVVAAGGCAATVASDGYGPDLVTVSPGVQVIADYDEPIFYSDGYYWRNYGGGWYRSSYYTGGWVYARPPAALMRIDRPYAYAHYRPYGWRGHPRTVAPAPGWRGGGAPAGPPRRRPGGAAAAPLPPPTRGAVRTRRRPRPPGAAARRRRLPPRGD